MADLNKMSLTEKAEAAFRQAAIKLIRLARFNGTTLIVWDAERGQIRELTADEAEKQLPPLPAESSSH
jgi:hypothetical protein